MPTLSRILRKFEERGLRKGLKQVAINMYKRNFDLQTISEILNVDIKTWFKEKGLL